MKWSVTSSSSLSMLIKGEKDVLARDIGFLDADSQPKFPAGMEKLVDQLLKALLCVCRQDLVVSKKHFSGEQ